MAGSPMVRSYQVGPQDQRGGDGSWQLKGRGQWKYLYRAADNDGRTVDFLLTARRDRDAAVRIQRYFRAQRRRYSWAVLAKGVRG